jgi:hypothetical protein
MEKTTRLPLTKDQEADLIVEKLKKTDAERAREREEWLENELTAALSQEIVDEIDREILNRLWKLD